MKKIVTAGICAIISLSVLGASLSTPAHAGKKERRIAAGVAIGAVAGLIIAGELSRRVNGKRARKNRRKAHRKHQRQIRQERRHQRRWQSDRYYNDYDRYDRYESAYQPDRDFDDYADDYRHEPRAKKQRGKRISKKSNGHIQRCTQAYRSYDPQSDTYIGYDGKERVCRK